MGVRAEIKLVFLGLTILVVLVMGTRRALDRPEERKGDSMCWATVPTEVGGSWSSLCEAQRRVEMGGSPLPGTWTPVDSGVGLT